MTNKNLRRPTLLAASLFAAFAMGACTPAETPKTAPNTVSNPTAPAGSPAAPASPEVANPGEAAVQKMLGRWSGPEGTFINITEKKAADGKQQLPRKFEIELADLDGPKKYEGTAKNGTIEFTRNGKTETVKAATGAETGMKNFEKETNCLVVTAGKEGFCRKADASPASSPASSPAASPQKK